MPTNKYRSKVVLIIDSLPLPSLLLLLLHPLSRLLASSVVARMTSYKSLLPPSVRPLPVSPDQEYVKHPHRDMSLM